MSAPFRRLLTALLLAVVLLAVVLLGGAKPAACDEGPGHLSNVQAAYLYKLIKYVTWPREGELSVFRVGVLGVSPVADRLETIARKRRAKGLPMAVTHFGALSAVADCEVLLLAEADPRRVAEVVAALKTRPILTVGLAPGAAAAGAAVGFRLVDRKLRFEVNLATLRRAGLVASSQVLGMALIVDDAAPRGSPSPTSAP